MPQKPKHSLLLAEDDQNFGMMLQSFLSLHDFEVAWVYDGVAALEKFRRQRFDLCILDVMMPDKDGFSLARDMLKIAPDTPFIFLTAKSMKEDKIQGFRLGALDYLVKPFDPDILLLKLRALLRQQKAGTHPVSTRQIGSFVFDPEKRLLQRGGQNRKLSPKEAALLQLLAQRQGELLSREEALIKIWKEDNYFTAQSMNVFVSKLRRYLDEDPDFQIGIENIHGSGFILAVHPRY